MTKEEFANTAKTKATQAKELMAPWVAAALWWLWIHTFDLCAVGITDNARARKYHNKIGSILSRSSGKWLVSIKGLSTKGKAVHDDFLLPKHTAMWMLFAETVQFILNIGEYATSPEPIKAEPKVGRNQKCPCNSGKKYKHCCANKEDT